MGPTKKQLMALESLRPETTTRSEVRKLLGKPWRSAEGAWRLDIYQLGKRQLDGEGFSPGHLAKSGDVIDLTTLYLLFNSSEVLERTNIHHWSATGKVKKFLVNRIGPEFFVGDQQRIQVGATKLADLEEWLGPPVLKGPNERGELQTAWFSTLHGYGGTVHFFEHQNLTVTLDSNETVRAFELRGRLTAPKK